MDFGGAPTSSNAPSWGSRLSRVFGNGANAMSALTGRISYGVVGLVVLVLVLVIVISYAVRHYLMNNLKQVDVTTGVAHCRTGSRTVSGTVLPTLSNGREWTVNFWVYVENTTHTATDKNILTFGSDVDSAALLVLMDRSVNRMYFVYRTSGAASTDSAVSALNAFRAGGATGSHVVVPIDYVPIDRWLMVSAVVDQDTVSTYTDHTLYSVVSAARFRPGAVIRTPESSSIVIGSPTNGADAFLANVKFFNYGISIYQSQTIYKRGPGTGGLQASIGFGSYKLQWPIVSATSSSSDDS